MATPDARKALTAYHLRELATELGIEDQVPVSVSTSLHLHGHTPTATAHRYHPGTDQEYTRLSINAGNVAVDLYGSLAQFRDLAERINQQIEDIVRAEPVSGTLDQIADALIAQE